MASNETAGLLPGRSAPLSTITSRDQSGVVLIATALGLAFALVSMLIRVYIQIGLRTAADAAAVLSAVTTSLFKPTKRSANGSLQVFYLFQASSTFVGSSKGWGKTAKDIPDSQLLPLHKAIYSSEILYIITLWLTKCSVALLFIKLSPDKRHSLASYSILGASTVFMVISVLTVSLRCDLAQPWIFIGATCTHVLSRWRTVAAMDIITEVALFSTSIYLVKNLQLSLHKKSLVVLAFGLRLPMTATTILRLDSIQSTIDSTDPTLKGTMAQVYTQIELCYAIIAATTPCLRPFMKALSTHYGAPASIKSTPTNTHAYTLNSFSKRSKISGTKPSSQDRMETNPDDMNMPNLRWDKSSHHASVVSGDQRSIQSHDSKQMIISKNSQWTINYETELGKCI
ncbi:hypothetical protein ONS95_014197 [Cadophora gregata]|uniref:uncharacterized protein n=1 Tax=Cadophora gregata TaxID=51156 RepID=UPI0026DC2BBD|nr:uncharacterized protein ONS95_014197 [Cadophora gregata]KAK0113952.1 hypothetical protein ONS96_014801 [Cadophora gregata f. sp. sojae]KAK0114713.1 hypothetical protein ONS95_014197 [Cadophora gregata]